MKKHSIYFILISTIFLTGVFMLGEIFFKTIPNQITQYIPPASTQVAAVADFDSNLVAHYTFDDTANDSAGSNNGTLVGGSTYVDGKIGKALQFDGVNDYVNTGSDIVGTGADSISMWVYPRIIATGYYLVSNAKFAIQLLGSSQFRFTSNGFGNIANSGNNLKVNSWNLVTVTRDASGVANLYINGILSGSANQNSGTPTAGTQNLIITNYSDAFSGSLDDVRIYNRVLSDQEISDLYTFGSGAPLPPIPPGDTTSPTISSVQSTSTITTNLATSGDQTFVTTQTTSSIIPDVVVSARDHTEIIPADRRIDWSKAGVVQSDGTKGIPNRTVKCITTACTALENAVLGYKNGTLDAQPLIQAAIVSAVANTYVYIPAGTYLLINPINFNAKKTISDVTLRGAGQGVTILIPKSWAAITSGGNGMSAERTVLSGMTKGSTSITVSDASGIQAGTMISLYQGNDPDFYWSRWGGKDHTGQYLMVTGVSGSTIQFEDPLIWNFSVNPRFTYMLYPLVKRVGVEDLSIRPDSTYNGTMIQYVMAYAPWIKNVEMMGGAGNDMMNINMVFRAEIRDSYIHDSLSTSDGYGIISFGGWPKGAASSGLLVENNIFSGLRHAIVLEGDSGGVMAYNYARNTRWSGWPNYMLPDFNSNHGEHGMMVLWEGNVATEFQDDGYHGSISHQTLFRNAFTGKHSDPAHTGNRITIDLTHYSYYINLIGNILGDPSWIPASYEMTGIPLYPQTQTIYRLGYPNVGNNGYCPNLGEYWYDAGCTTQFDPKQGNAPGWIDTKVKSTLLRHGNYDYQTRSTIWDPNISNHNLPASLYLSGKPAWFGSVPFPPIGPDVSGMTNKIPAQICYEQGKMPNCLSNSGDTPAPTTSTPGDFNSDGSVNAVDFSILSFHWNQIGPSGPSATTYDLNKDGIVNSLDFSIMATHWTG